MKDLNDMSKDELIQNVVVLNKTIETLAKKLTSAEINIALLEAQMPEESPSQ